MRRRIRLAVLRRRGLRIGRDCRILEPLPHIMNEPYLVSIGNHCTISSGVAFVTHDGATWLFRDEPEYRNLRRYAAIEIHEDCFIGTRAIILPGATVGPNAIVGAGTVVTEDVAPNTVGDSNPAHFICTMDEYKAKMLQKGMRLSARSRAALRRELEVGCKHGASSDEWEP
jgi:acetyltransferase-like isoleucine patch superfamily enzyme